MMVAIAVLTITLIAAVLCLYALKERENKSEKAEIERFRKLQKFGRLESGRLVSIAPQEQLRRVSGKR